MVVQFDDTSPPPLKHAFDSLGGVRACEDDPIAECGCRVVGLAKLKCLPYLQRTFGVRNLLPVLLEQGGGAYLERVEGFFRAWQLPAQHRERLRPLFSGWAREVEWFDEREKQAERLRGLGLWSGLR